MAKPYFSIVIPCLNEEKFLPILLANLTSQSFKDFEVLVVDGNSDDKTVQKAKAFQKRINLRVFGTKKRNVSYQRNLGAKKAKGNLIIFFDADTQIPVKFLVKVKEAFEKDKPDFASTWIKVKSRLETDRAIATGTNIIFEISKFFSVPSAYGAMLLAKRDVFLKLKGFDDKIKFGEDTEIVQRAVKKGYEYALFRNIYYYFSLRRFKKEGTLNMIRDYAFLNLNQLVKFKKLQKLVEYEMGGHLFESKKKRPQSLLWIEEALKAIKKSSKKKSRRNLFQFIEKLKDELRD